MNEIGMPGWFASLVTGVVRGIEVIGIAVIVGGGLAATTVALRRLMQGLAFDGTYATYRGDLGRAILLGLELLVAADIIGTVAVDPTFGSLGALALIVVIRTFLSFSLEVEVSGHWPWEEGRRSAKR